MLEEPEIIYKDLSYKLIGACMEVHNILGKGHLENVYKDALEHELTLREIAYSKESRFTITYKGVNLPHSYKADFIIEDKIILEVKAVSDLNSSHSKQTLNYIAAAKLKLGILVNFGEDSLTYKRVVL